jgi:hypothetical protein
VEFLVLTCLKGIGVLEKRGGFEKKNKGNLPDLSWAIMF